MKNQPRGRLMKRSAAALALFERIDGDQSLWLDQWNAMSRR
jgi:hypothetical protein